MRITVVFFLLCAFVLYRRVSGGTGDDLGLGGVGLGDGQGGALNTGVGQGADWGHFGQSVGWGQGMGQSAGLGGPVGLDGVFGGGPSGDAGVGGAAASAASAAAAAAGGGDAGGAAAAAASAAAAAAGGGDAGGGGGPIIGLPKPEKPKIVIDKVKLEEMKKKWEEFKKKIDKTGELEKMMDLKGAKEKMIKLAEKYKIGAKKYKEAWLKKNKFFVDLIKGKATIEDIKDHLAIGMGMVEDALSCLGIDLTDMGLDIGCLTSCFDEG